MGELERKINWRELWNMEASRFRFMIGATYGVLHLASQTSAKIFGSHNLNTQVSAKTTCQINDSHQLWASNTYCLKYIWSFEWNQSRDVCRPIEALKQCDSGSPTQASRLWIHFILPSVTVSFLSEFGIKGQNLKRAIKNKSLAEESAGEWMWLRRKHATSNAASWVLVVWLFGKDFG